MTKIPINMKSATRLFLAAMILVLAFGTFTFAQGQRYKGDQAWSFGILADTQWTLGNQNNIVDPAGTNPNYTSHSIADQIKNQFIMHNVKFTFQLGDSGNLSGDAAFYKNAEKAQVLYDANIGYFPIRGNHDEYGYMYGFDGADTNGDGLMDYTANVPAFLDAFPQTRGSANTFGATNFSSPTELIPFDPSNAYSASWRVFAPNSDLNGLSYSFDYGPTGNKARFVLLDTNAMDYRWIDTNGDGKTTCDPPNYSPCEIYGITYIAGQQQKWISERLNKDARGTTQAFVMSHRGIMGSNHADGIFGSSTSSKSWAQLPFYASLAGNDVKHYISGHDHLYNRSIVKSLDFATTGNQVTQIISSGASTKFYAPAALTQDKINRETEISQELRNVGYYIYTVDGPRVNVDYYSDATGNLQDDYCYPNGVAGAAPRSCANAPGSVDSNGNPTGPLVPGTLITPTFNFVKKDNYGYSLNGQQFLVAQSESYTKVADGFKGTVAKILAGTNNSTAKDATPVKAATPPSAPRPFVKAVNTGWTEKNSSLFSDILSLWGMADFDTEKTDVYALSMKYSFTNAREFMKASSDILKGKAGIAALDQNGNWVNAVDLNVGSSYKKFVYGPYQSYYKLGTYGLNYLTGEVWAVINYNADFALADFAVKP
jgi:hypothetical protein